MLIAIGTDLSDLWTAGTGTFLDEAVTGLGWENIAGGLGFSWGQISLEYILAENPEVILTEMDPAVFQDDAFFKDLTAVRQDQVFQIDVDLLSRPGPRLIQALRIWLFSGSGSGNETQTKYHLFLLGLSLGLILTGWVALGLGPARLSFPLVPFSRRFSLVYACPGSF